MSRYCRAVDDREFDLFAELLAENVRFEMGDVTESRAELLEYIQANLSPAGRHIYANPVVTIDGDTAHVDSDWVWSTPTSYPLARAVTPTICGASTGTGCSPSDASRSPSTARDRRLADARTMKAVQLTGWSRRPRSMIFPCPSPARARCCFRSPPPACAIRIYT